MMYFTFREKLAERSGLDGWTLTSRGTRPGREPICGLAGKMLVGHDGADEFTLGHHPRALGLKHLEKQDLVVVATLQERARLARLSPGDRPRVFTLREATLLGEAPPTSAEIERAAAFVSAEWNSPVRAYARLLNERRGLVRPSLGWSARGLARGRKSDPLDIPDAHHKGFLTHSLALRRVRSETNHLAEQMLRFLAELD